VGRTQWLWHAGREGEHTPVRQAWPELRRMRQEGGQSYGACGRKVARATAHAAGRWTERRRTRQEGGQSAGACMRTQVGRQTIHGSAEHRASHNPKGFAHAHARTHTHACAHAHTIPLSLNTHVMMHIGSAGSAMQTLSPAA